MKIVAFGRRLPGLTWQITPAEQALVYRVPQRRKAQWDAYDNTRTCDDVGWRPRPIRDALQDYVAWIRDWEQP